jgi:hypothetical protein
MIIIAKKVMGKKILYGAIYLRRGKVKKLSLILPKNK